MTAPPTSGSGPTNIYFGTTSEPDPSDSRHWTIQRDLTDYSSIFTTAQDGAADIGNLVNKTYTGVIYGTVTMYFYPPSAKASAPVTADQVIAFSGGPTGGTVALDTTGQCCQPSLAQTLTLPDQHPEAPISTSLRKARMTTNSGTPACPTTLPESSKAAPTLPSANPKLRSTALPPASPPSIPGSYTGGIDPYLWFPIPGVQTLNFIPYRVDLTPFASHARRWQSAHHRHERLQCRRLFLGDRFASALSRSRLNASDRSRNAEHADRAVARRSPRSSAHRGTACGGTVNTVNTHDFTISGYVNTSAGTVTTTLAQSIDFSNLQKFTINDVAYVQDITQNTNIERHHNGGRLGRNVRR